MSTIKIPLQTSTLILGGARSGKSRHAEQLALESSKDVIYIATATAQDTEMEKRIEQHKHDRPSSWTTIEEPIHLADTLLKHSSPERIILIDCLTLWLTNLLSINDEILLESEIKKLLVSLPKLTSNVIFVSNEVSMGIIPIGELTRKYVDEAGRLHQQLAQQVNTVILMVAGLPHFIKQDNH